MNIASHLVRSFRIGAFVIAGLAGTASVQAATTVYGAGSTFVNPLMIKWAARFGAQSGSQVSYLAIGSGGGIRKVQAKSVTFGASDKPLSPGELKAAGLAQFPLVIGGVVPIVNLDEIESGQLSLTGPLLADIFLAKIKFWNDPAIVALNPDVKLPPLKISVVHRSDSSGTTFNWVNYLSKVSVEWQRDVGEGATVKWPTGIDGRGNEGVARNVGAIKGAIGYVELANAAQRNLKVAKVVNRSGNAVMPSPTSFQAAASNATWQAPDFYELLTDTPGEQSWPITATVFVLLPRQPVDATQSTEALRFFQWALEHGQADAQSLNYVPLPDRLVEQVKNYWTQALP